MRNPPEIGGDWGEEWVMKVLEKLEFVKRTIEGRRWEKLLWENLWRVKGRSFAAVVAEEDEQSVKNIIDAILLDFLQNNLALRNPMILVRNEFRIWASRVSGFKLVASEGLREIFVLEMNRQNNRTTSFYGWNGILKWGFNVENISISKNPNFLSSSVRPEFFILLIKIRKIDYKNIPLIFWVR